ncbi:MAG TPA: S8 family serine peptidase [Thermoanaerobaculia bacterium]|nr:S8 family serine peptidase [Thermoanaerobaculia bacterium]
MSRSLSVLAPVAVCSALVLGLPALGGRDAPWQDKVDPWILDRITEAGSAELLVVLAEQADLAGAAHLPSKEAKGRYVFERLRETAAKSQGPLLAELRNRGVEHRPYWVANMIWMRADRATIEALARREDVARLHANPVVRMDLPAPEPELPAAPTAPEWGVNMVAAPTLWAQGFTGLGIVVAGEDTGYDWDHPALIGKYRGWNGASADHNFNWWDAIHSGGGSCGANSIEPCDDNNHGTHTMGTMVGDDGGSNQIGVAPGAKWIGCRNMDQGNGTPTTYAECFQFFIAPTDLMGMNPDPTKAPHVINNSWGCPPSEGCTGPNVLQMVVENVRAAGILPVVSAGNSGSGCSSVDTPAAIYDASFTVGSTTISNTISSFSSRGPVTVDGSNRLKPDVSAPGSSVRSSIRNGAYSTFSGTSMAGPHVAGVSAVLMSASPGLAGNVDALEECIRQTAAPFTSAQTCGGVPGSQIPNNTFGWGRVQLPWPLPPVCDLTALFSDGFETGDTSVWTLVFP